MERTVADARVVTTNGTARRGLQASEHRILLVCGDFLAASAAVVVSIWLWSITAGFPLTATFVGERAAWFLAAPAWMLVLLPSHNARTALSLRATAAALLRTMAVLLGIYLAVYFYVPPRALPRLVALYILWEGALLVLAWRLVYLWVFRQAAFQRRVLIVGAGERARAAIRLIRDAAPRNTAIAGVVTTTGSTTATIRLKADTTDGCESVAENGLHPDALDAVPVVGDIRALADHVRARGIAEVVLASPNQPGDALFSALLECQELGIDIVGFPQLYEQILQRVPIAHVDREWLLTSFADAIRAEDASRIVKRVIDVTGAVFGLVCLAALAPLIMLAIRIDSRGPVFFRQTRVGLAGAPFEILKFRTMTAVAADPKVTRVGRILRRIRVDELPNILNVLRGEMSLVGPRPERPELVAVLEQRVPFYRTRLIVRPGLTGWAQVNRPYASPIEGAAEKLEYDLYYLKHRTAAFDAWILLRTIGTVLRLRGR